MMQCHTHNAAIRYAIQQTDTTLTEGSDGATAADSDLDPADTEEDKTVRNF